MKFRKILKTLLVVGLVVCLALIGRQTLSIAQQSRPSESAIYNRQTFSGPYTHQNLTLYLVHSDDQIKAENILSLQEALDQQKVRVHETSNVNQLAVENISKNEVIYIQAGEIVRGGKQDRVLEIDLLVKPKSGKVPIGSFCVEQGRWRRRGNESPSYFSSSNNIVSSKGLKLAVTKSRKQHEVWSQVADTQRRLSKNLRSPVTSRTSETSLELSLENRKLQKSVDNYTSKLSSVINDKDNTVGMVSVINGKIYCADTYASSKLFRKLWPKLLKANAIEAIASKHNSKIEKLPTINDVQKFLSAAQQGKATTKKVSASIKMITRDSNECVMYETFDKKDSTISLHRNYVKK
ncbi:MAG: hypothetical protein JSV03_05515 [Planctomycetota bacterium]|nr:MAG: hypothetical protein JSV03_05515 [Planctomycetota bacterium]